MDSKFAIIVPSKRSNKNERITYARRILNHRNVCIVLTKRIRKIKTKWYRRNRIRRVIISYYYVGVYIYVYGNNITVTVIILFPRLHYARPSALRTGLIDNDHIVRPRREKSFDDKSKKKKAKYTHTHACNIV